MKYNLRQFLLFIAGVSVLLAMSRIGWLVGLSWHEDYAQAIVLAIVFPLALEFTCFAALGMWVESGRVVEWWRRRDSNAEKARSGE